MPLPAQRGPTARTPPKKPTLNMDRSRAANPSHWLNFSLPPRQRSVPGSTPRRSRKGEGWRGGIITRERYVHANFRFVLKPTETLSYGAHFADPDISLHWANILQVLVPTFSAFSVAQGYVTSESHHDDTVSIDEDELESMGEDAAERRRRVEEERRGRMCPICLGPPVAGRMTKCGHLSDIPKSAKCPICGDTVHEGMLKSVRYLDATTMLGAAHGDDDTKEDLDREVGMVGEMDGFEEARPQMTTMALPSSSTWPSDAIPPHTAPWHFLPDVLSFSRFVLATPKYMMVELERELNELKDEWEKLRGDTLGRDFVRAARDKVDQQIGKVRAELMTELVRRSEKESREAWDEAVGGTRKEAEKRRERDRLARIRDAGPQETGDIPKEYLAIQDSTFTIPPNIYVEPNRMPPKRSRRRPTGSTPMSPIPPSPSYFFYQSSLGANVFLHPLDIRILLAHYKSYSLFPTTLTLHSAGFDPGTINDELRKRCKYLSHLPAGTEVVFVEAELEELVGKESVMAFEQPLKARREKRRARVKREDRAKSRWEQAERDKMPVMIPSEDREFSLALARSTVETTWTEDLPLLVGSASSSGLAPLPSPSSSPSDLAIVGPQSQPRPSFASALHSTAPATPTPMRRREAREADVEVDAAWEAFERLSVSPEDIDMGTIRESEKGGGTGRKGGKKGQKKLVLGGGGARRA